MHTLDTAATLTGSTKQISWATDIRAQMFAGWDRLVALDYRTELDTLALADVNGARLAQALLAQHPDETAAALANIAAITDATWWIDNRGVNATYGHDLPLLVKTAIKAARKQAAQ